MLQYLCALTGVLVLAARVGAATYWVDPTGSNTGDGSQASPWLTLQHAANAVAAGDSVRVRPGEYAGFHLTTSGAAGSPITFLADPGARVTTANPVTPDGINLEGASHVVIDGFEVLGMQRAGVRSVGPYSGGQQAFAERVTVRNVTARDNGKWGILTGFVHDLLIEQNETSGSLDEHGIYVGNSGDRPVIRGNTIWGNRGNGIHVNSDLFSGLDGVIEDAVISGNVIYDNGVGGGSGINLDGVREALIENNLLYDNHASGISLYQIDGALPATGATVRNNTVLQASDGRWALNLRDGAANATIANNIFLSAHNWRGAVTASPDSLPGLVSDYNAVIDRFTTDDADSVLSLAAWQTETGQDANSFVATAAELFVDPANDDYRLRADSPARDAGWNAHAAAVDLTGLTRPQGGVVDIGAYELAAAPLTGDYNHDGLVDAADYGAWAAAYGQAGLGLPADGNADGVVNAADYTVWRDAAVATLGTVTAVPAPNGVVVFAALSAWLRRCRKSSAGTRSPFSVGGVSDAESPGERTRTVG